MLSCLGADQFMADYYSVVSRAVSGLPGNTYETRRVLYDRARAALRDTLRKHDPPLSEIALANERSAFEAAIRKVETESLFNDMRLESEEYAALSTQRRFILTAEEFARFARAKLKDTISIIRDRGRSRNERANTISRMLLAKVIPIKGNIATQGPVSVQRIQLTAKNIGRSIWLSTFGKRFQS
jgi:hypothetical protein